MYILGLDIGSSFLKSCILDLTNRRTFDATRLPTPDFLPLPSCQKEIPIRRLADAVRQMIESAAAKTHLSGIVLSVQMHGFMLYRPDGTPETDYISWQDTRAVLPDASGRTLLDLVKESVSSSLFEENGINLKPNHSLLPLLHWVRARPEDGPLEFSMIGDGLIRLLTGEKVPIHPSVAASSGLYSLRRQNWNRDLIQALGFTRISFPPVLETRQPLAFYNSSHGKIPIFSALGDQQAAVLGIHAEAGDMFLNIGTGGQIGYVGRGVMPGPYETRPFFQNQTIRSYTQLPSGRTLNILMNFIGDIGKTLFGATAEMQQAAWKQMDALTAAADASANGLVMDLSFFETEGGSISGITAENLSVQSLFYSAYAAMAKSYRTASRQLLCAGDPMPASLICTGGVIRKNPILLKCIEEQFHLPCLLAPCSDDTMLGLLRYALWCCSGVSLYADRSAQTLEREISLL